MSYILIGVGSLIAVLLVAVRFFMYRAKKADEARWEAEQAAARDRVAIENSQRQSVAVNMAKLKAKIREREAQDNADKGIKNSFDKDTF